MAPRVTEYRKTLQRILQQLVHARHLGRDAEIDRPIANLDNEPAADVWLNLYSSI